MNNIASREVFDREIQAAEGRLILFYSNWCPFCLAFLPVFEKYALRNPEIFRGLSADTLPGLEEAFAVEVVPSALFFRGGKLAGRLDGALGRGISERDLEKFVTRHVTGAKS